MLAHPWENATKSIHNFIFEPSSLSNNQTRTNFRENAISLHQKGFELFLTAWFEEEIKKFVKSRLQSLIWDTFDNEWSTLKNESTEIKSQKAEELVTNFVLELERITQGLYDTIDGLTEMNIIGKGSKEIHDYWKTIFFLNRSNSFVEVGHIFLKRNFCGFAQMTGQTLCFSFELSEDECLRTMEIIRKIVFCLSKLDLLDRVFDNCWSSIPYDAIKNHVHQYASQFDEQCLEGILVWVESVVFDWVKIIIGQEKDESSGLQEKWKRHLLDYTYRTFAEMRINCIFDIIVDYDNEEFLSKPALLDLKECLLHSDQKVQLVNHLQSENKRRLLHRGADTSDIITNFHQMIGALRLIDPSEMMLKVVQGDIQKYLRSRADTIRCIVSMLVDDNDDETIPELLHSDNDDSDDEDWSPLPRFPCDNNNVEVNIYESKENFVNDYCGLMAERLLAQTGSEYEKEIRTLELLKIKFSEELFSKCSVMLDDMADSKRLNTMISSRQREGDLGLDVIILSKLFWPSLNEEEFSLPLAIKRKMDEYNQSFQRIKAARSLTYMPNLGKVNLELSFEDREVNVTVSPFLASMIVLFEEQGKWSLKEIANKMEVTTTIIRKRIPFWINEGVLHETEEGVFEIIEIKQNTVDQSKVLYVEDSAAASAEDQESEDLERCWQFTYGMLTNLGSLPFERIHSMLSMCVGGIVPSQSRLTSFFMSKVGEGLLEFSAGEYSLPK